MKDILPEGTPRHDVWIHLTGGMDQAREELDALDEEERLLLEVIAEYVFQARTRSSVRTSSGDLVRQLVPVLDSPWVKLAVELRLAEDFVDRGVGAFTRFRKLVAVLLAADPGGSTSSYVREASLAYVYGLYPSCIVFAGASLESLLRGWLSARGIGVPPKATAGVLLEQVGRERGGRVVRDDGRALLALRNDVAHGRPPEQNDLPDAALESIRRLTQILAVLDGYPDPQSEGCEVEE